MITLPVEEFLAEHARGRLCIFDVRSPSEYARGSLPGATSLPLFDDNERALFGQIYHTHGRTAALKCGLELVGPKMRSFVESVEERLSAGQAVGLYCWRGGMRSASVAWLMEFYGFEVVLLRGGYKAFRRLVLALFDIPRTLLVVGGCTGAGKTAMLRHLTAMGEATVDLETLAHHRGSAFGALGMTSQPSQQNFENMLAFELWKFRAAKRIWLEDESRRIGALMIPDGLWKQMLTAPILALDVPLEQRIESLVKEYGSYSVDELSQCLAGIRNRLGAERYTRALTALHAGKLRDVTVLALEYYDKSYRHSYRKRAERVRWVNADQPAAAATLLVNLASQIELVDKLDGVHEDNH